MFDYEYHFEALMEAISEIDITIEQRDSAVQNSMRAIMACYDRDANIVKKRKTKVYYQWKKAN